MNYKQIEIGGKVITPRTLLKRNALWMRLGIDSDDKLCYWQAVFGDVLLIASSKEFSPEYVQFVRWTEVPRADVEVRPMTDAEKAAVAKQRGRGSFGENHTSNTMTDYIPGEHGRRFVGLGWFPHD